jgi:tetratricopeptide (TPR) repeat protein
MAPIERYLAEGARHRREGRSEDALRAYQAAVDHARTLGPSAALLDALCGLGQVERDLGHREAATGRYEEALALCRTQGHSLRLAHVARHLGDLQRERERYAESRPLLEEALDLYRNSVGAPPLDVANALRSLALLLESTGSRAGASSLWREARQLYAAAGVDAGVQECDARLASSDPA